MAVNVFLIDSNDTDITGKRNGTYVFIDEWGEDIPERVRNALLNSGQVWHMPTYVNKVIIGYTLGGVITDQYGGGVGTKPGSADFPVLVVDTANQFCAFAHHGDEREPSKWYKEMPWAKYVEKERSFPRGALI